MSDELVYFMVSLNDAPYEVVESVRESVLSICQEVGHKDVTFHYDDPISDAKDDCTYFMIALDSVSYPVAEKIRLATMLICWSLKHRGVVFHYSDPIAAYIDEELDTE